MSAQSRPTPDDISKLPTSERIGHLLWETSNHVVLLAEPILDDLHLSLSSMGALERIQAVPGITGSELARQAFKTQQAVSQVTNRLERVGYVERRVGAGRGVGLYLTSLGEAALAEGRVREARVDARLAELLGSADAEQLRTLLRRLREALQAAAD